MRSWQSDSKIGIITITENLGAITNIRFPREAVPTDTELEKTPLIAEAFRQITAYFDRNLFAFDLPLAPAGTDFMRRVWKQLQKVEYGRTVSYKDIALGIGSPNACRAVGMACSRNPIPIIIPCHRIIGSGGSLVGFRGGLDLKQRLLAFEADETVEFY